MIMYVYGADTLRSRAHLRKLIEQFKKQRDPAGYNQKVIDGAETTGGELFGEITAAPFMAEKRLVVVENMLSSSDKELLAEIIERLEKKTLPESTVIIFWQGAAHSKVKEAKELHAMLLKEKFVSEFELLAGEKLMQWVHKEVQDRGGSIEPAAENRLVASCAGDMWQLQFLVHQLSAFKNGSAITVADVQEFVNEKVDDNVFAMVEALVAGNREQCYKLLGEQRRQGEEEIKLFGLIVWQFRTLISVSDLLARESNLTSDVIASRLKLHPFVAKKNMASARRYSLAKLEVLYKEMVAMDEQIKTGEADPALVLDLFIAKV